LRTVWRDTGVHGKSFIALAPGATYGEAKRWPLPHWTVLIQKLLAERKESLLILGGLEEEDYLKPLLAAGTRPEDARRLHLLAGRTSPMILGSMLAHCKLLITNDTGPMHVAAAVGTPTVALFGSTSPTWTRPFGLGHQVIYHHVECSPCFQKTCPIGYLCLHKISVEEVFRTAMKMLKNPVKIQAEKLPASL
jgi:heptosyltransferase-2